ncbi:T3SS effector HopA1 family protein [Nonomuraea sp. NPDC050153]|uniref:T3SS effector HopA1 family protein n=1 Tax=Nonomuraea sp. NPDC050153 TaxID=3364359 RepID=UPI0037B123B2
MPPLDLSVVKPTSDRIASPRVTRTGAGMLSDQDRYRLNDNRDKKFVDELYEEWYDGASGDRRSGTDADTWEDVYGLMGVGSAGYLKKAIDTMEVWDFVRQGQTDGYVVENQGAEDDPPVEFWRGLSGGDYFRVLKSPSGSLSAEDVRNRSRRLIVNLNSQEAGLRVAKALTPLFKDPTLGDNFSQFKVYLSSKAYPNQPVKNDKMVVYYVVGEDADGSGADAVGDKLISTIDGAIRPGDANISVSPFYSRLTEAVSWAEEAEEYMSVEERQSFTMSRAKVIASVLQDNPNVRDAAELETLIKKAFQDKGIRAEARHRHMPPPPFTPPPVT